MSPLAAQRRRNATTDPRRLTSEALPIGLPFRVIEGRHFQVVDDSQRSSRQEHVWVAARIRRRRRRPSRHACILQRWPGRRRLRIQPRRRSRCRTRTRQPRVVTTRLKDGGAGGEKGGGGRRLRAADGANRVAPARGPAAEHQVALRKGREGESVGGVGGGKRRGKAAALHAGSNRPATLWPLHRINRPGNEAIS